MVRLHPSTCIQQEPTWVIYNEYVLTKKEYIRTCTQIEAKWLLEVAPEYYDLRLFPEGDARDDLLKILARQSKRKTKEADQRKKHHR
jgi:pre-mRNA-splicing factor ATP-dependent RNA helicase DHX15/PRP43